MHSIMILWRSADCAERLRQKKELDLVLGERDILGTQLIRRNDELALLYEKVKIQQSTLSRGQIQYRDRCAACFTDGLPSKGLPATTCARQLLQPTAWLMANAQGSAAAVPS